MELPNSSGYKINFQKIRILDITNIFFLFSECLCHAEGSASNECTEAEGICTCKPNIVGEKCDKAAPGYYNFPEVIRKYICLK